MTQQGGAIVVGTGIGCLEHVRAMRRAGIEVRALVGRDVGRTEARARVYEIPEFYTSLSVALASVESSLVVVATSPDSHEALVMEALQAGRNVVCEKPLARNGVEGRRMLRAAEDANVVHVVGNQLRFVPAQALMARVVASGQIGDPRLATFLWHAALLAEPANDVPSWFADRSQGGGWLQGFASHQIDYVRLVLGEFDGVSAALPRIAQRGWTAEDSYSIRFRLRSGVDGVLESTAAAHGPMISVNRIVGTEATVWTEDEAVFIANASGTSKVPLSQDLELIGEAEPPPDSLLITTYDKLHGSPIQVLYHTRMYEKLDEVLSGTSLGGDPQLATFRDGVAVLDVLDAVRRSASEGGWVDVISPTTVER